MSARTCLVHTSVLVLALLGGPARGDDRPATRTWLPVPGECMQYWAIPGGLQSPAGWNQAISFAACLQDATIERVDDVDQLPELVDRLELALVPSMELYLAVIEDGPGPAKLRATLQLAMAQVALITRARSSIVAPPELATSTAAYARYARLHARLEPLLEQPARFAYDLILLIDREVTLDPTLAPDAVTRGMVRAARESALLLRRRWSPSTDERETGARAWRTRMNLRELGPVRFVGSPP